MHIEEKKYKSREKMLLNVLYVLSVSNGPSWSESCSFIFTKSNVRQDERQEWTTQTSGAENKFEICNEVRISLM